MKNPSGPEAAGQAPAVMQSLQIVGASSFIDGDDDDCDSVLWKTRQGPETTDKVTEM